MSSFQKVVRYGVIVYFEKVLFSQNGTQMHNVSNGLTHAVKVGFFF